MLGWSMLAKYGVLWFYDSPRIYFQNTWFKRNKPQKNMFDTPGTARKLLNVLPFKPSLLASKGIQGQILPSIITFSHRFVISETFFPPLFLSEPKKHRCGCRRRFHWRNPSSAVGSRSRCRDPVRLHHGGAQCTVAGGTEARGRGTGDQLRHDTRESTGYEFGLLKTHPRGFLPLEKNSTHWKYGSKFFCCTWLICFCVGFLSRNTRMVLGIEINQKAATKRTHLFSSYFRVKFWK